MSEDFGIIIDALSKEDIVQLVETSAQLRADSKSLGVIEQAATLCHRWGNILLELMEQPQLLYVHQCSEVRQPVPFYLIGEELQNGKVVMIQVLLPDKAQGVNHVYVYTIEPQGSGKARVVQAWRGKHSLQPGVSLPIEEIISQLKYLELEMTPENIGLIERAQLGGKIWGELHKKLLAPSSGRKRVLFTSVISGKAKHRLKFHESFDELSRELVEFFEGHQSRVLSPQECKACAMIRSATFGGVVGSGLGLVFGTAGVLILDTGASEDKYKEELEADKGIPADGAEGAVAGGAATKSFKSRIPGLGMSVIRTNAVIGAAMFTVLAVWNVRAWATKSITTVELRRRFTKSITGSAIGFVGGAVAGAAAGAVGGIWLGPLGSGIFATVGGIIGAVAAGYGGAIAGVALDKAIWNADEDAIMNSYEFFGWRITRYNHEVKTGEEIAEAYHRKLGEKPNKVKEEEDWVLYCTAQLMVLLRGMYPEYGKLLDIAGKLKSSENEGVRIISTVMFALLHHQDG